MPLIVAEEHFEWNNSCPKITFPKIEQNSLTITSSGNYPRIVEGEYANVELLLITEGDLTNYEGMFNVWGSVSCSDTNWKRLVGSMDFSYNRPLNITEITYRNNFRVMTGGTNCHVSVKVYGDNLTWKDGSGCDLNCRCQIEGVSESWFTNHDNQSKVFTKDEVSKLNEAEILERQINATIESSKIAKDAAIEGAKWGGFIALLIAGLGFYYNYYLQKKRWKRGDVIKVYCPVQGKVDKYLQDVKQDPPPYYFKELLNTHKREGHRLDNNMRNHILKVEDSSKHFNKIYENATKKFTELAESCELPYRPGTRLDNYKDDLRNVIKLIIDKKGIDDIKIKISQWLQAPAPKFMEKLAELIKGDDFEQLKKSHFVLIEELDKLNGLLILETSGNIGKAIKIKRWLHLSRFQ